MNIKSHSLFTKYSRVLTKNKITEPFKPVHYIISLFFIFCIGSTQAANLVQTGNCSIIGENGKVQDVTAFSWYLYDNKQLKWSNKRDPENGELENATLERLENGGVSRMIFHGTLEFDATKPKAWHLYLDEEDKEPKEHKGQIKEGTGVRSGKLYIPAELTASDVSCKINANAIYLAKSKFATLPQTTKPVTIHVTNPPSISHTTFRCNVEDTKLGRYNNISDITLEYDLVETESAYITDLRVKIFGKSQYKITYTLSDKLGSIIEGNMTHSELPSQNFVLTHKEHGWFFTGSYDGKMYVDSKLRCSQESYKKENR
ncbi:MAG: hypothetical protein K0R49_648 [Burkholderiales bacterium]|jgi:hypothetical protein|nr:hypothetical protein [Burkholderiales bacterium]